MSVECPVVFDEVGLVSYEFGEVGLLSALVRQGRFSVRTCSTKWGNNRDMISDVGLVSGHVRRGLFCIGTCSAKSA